MNKIQFNCKSITQSRWWLSGVLLLMLCLSPVLQAQVSIGDGGTGVAVQPQDFSVLELITNNGKGGLRLPQMTTAERNALQGTAAFQAQKAAKTGKGIGLTIFNTDTGCVEYWNGSRWISMCQGNGSFTGGTCANTPIAAPGGTTTGCTVVDPSCTIAGNYSYVIIAGSDYASVTPASSADGMFTVTFQPNNTAFERKAVLMVTSPCGENASFIYTQTGAICPGTHINPTLNASTGTTCVGGMFYAWVTNAEAGATYIWTRNNIVVNTGIAFQTNVPGNYKVYTDVAGCGAGASLNLTAGATTAEQAVTISATNSGVSCSGSPVTLTAFNVPAGANVRWFKDGVQKSTGTATSFDTNEVGTWFALIGTESTCSSAPSNTISVTANTAGSLDTPVFTINGSAPGTAPYCKGGSLELKVTNTYPAGVTYQWYVNGIAATPAPVTSPIHYVVPSSLDNLSISVTVSKTGSCSASQSSASQNLTLTADPETSINGGKAAYICGAATAILTTGVNGASEYQWFRVIGGVDTKVGTTTINEYPTTVEGDYKVAIKTANGCVSKISSAISVVRSNYITLNWGPIPTPILEGSSKTISVVASPATNDITWESSTPGVTITPLSNKSEANVTFPATAGNVQIKVTATNGCGQAVLEKTDFLVTTGCTAASVVNITPNNNTIKSGTTLKLTASSNGSVSSQNYEWFVDGVSKQTGASNVFDFTGTATGNHTVKVKFTNSCDAVGKEASVTVTVTPNINDYTDYTGTASLGGKTCFDVAMINNDPGCGGAATGRTNDFANTYNFDYSFTFTGTGLSNLVFALTDNQSITNGITTNGTTGTLYFKPDTGVDKKTGGVRDLAKGTGNTDAKEVMVYALFEIGGTKYKIGLPIKVKDCICCPGYLAIGGEYSGPATTTMGGAQGLGFSAVANYFTSTGKDLCFYKKDGNNGGTAIQSNAIAACGNAAYFDSDGSGMAWRLPNVGELGAINTIVRSGTGGAADQGIGAQPTAIPGTKNLLLNNYWSSTVRDGSISWTWVYTGSIAVYFYKTYDNYVRCVRSF